MSEQEDKISILHGGGGVYMHKLLKEQIVPRFKPRKSLEIPLSLLADSAVIEEIAFTTDSYTVKPIFFPGGDIGRLSVSGTINDLSMIGAEPLAISCALILEEGFEFSCGRRACKSRWSECLRCGLGDLRDDQGGG